MTCLDIPVDPELVDQVAQVISSKDNLEVRMMSLHTLARKRLAIEGVMLSACLEHRPRIGTVKVPFINPGRDYLVDATYHDGSTENLQFYVCHDLELR